MPTPQSLYDLKLKADLNITSGQFLSQGPGNRSRIWAQLTAGDPNWHDRPNFNPDTHGNGPALSLNATDISNADSFQVTVYFVNALPTDFSSIIISAIFTPFAHNSLPIASPFSDANFNVQSIVSATWQPNTNPSNIHLHPDLPNGDHAIVFTPGPFRINPALIPRNPPVSTWKFEFTLVAQFTYPNGTIRQYAYDPEMEIDVSTSGEKPVPAAAYA